jgi:hypothetical protein
MHQKKEIVAEMQNELEKEKSRYKALKVEIKRLEKRAEQLQIILKQKEDELEQLEEMLRDRDSVIEDLERQIGGGEELLAAKNKMQLQQRAPGWYRPIKGDLVDELMANYFNQLKYPMPIKRLGDGFYVFGTKKIYVKLMQGRLVVRVGGGFMSVDEFLSQYSDMEFQKVQAMIENGTFNLQEYEDNLEETMSPPNRGRKSISRSPNRLLGSPKGLASPKNPF